MVKTGHLNWISIVICEHSLVATRVLFDSGKQWSVDLPRLRCVQSNLSIERPRLSHLELECLPFTYINDIIRVTNYFSYVKRIRKIIHVLTINLIVLLFFFYPFYRQSHDQKNSTRLLRWSLHDGRPRQAQSEEIEHAVHERLRRSGFVEEPNSVVGVFR